MAGFVPERRALLLLLLVLAVLLALMAQQVRRPEGDTLLQRALRGLVSPLLTTTSATVRGIGSIWHRYVDLRGARDEVERTRRERDESRALALLAEEVLRENRRLRSLLDLRDSQPDPSRVVAARVVGGAGDLLSDGILLDRGRRHGVVPGRPVIAVGGVVGRVVFSSARLARVQLLTDRTASLAVLEQETRAEGLVRGLGKEQCELTSINRAEEIPVGAQLITSGMERVYPRGLPVGIVEERPAPDQFDQGVAVRTMVDLSSLEEVLVLPLVKTRTAPESGAPPEAVEGEGS
jgi:rod shape-determining protein MreC